MNQLPPSPHCCRDKQAKWWAFLQLLYTEITKMEISTYLVRVQTLEQLHRSNASITSKPTQVTGIDLLESCDWSVAAASLHECTSTRLADNQVRFLGGCIGTKQQKTQLWRKVCTDAVLQRNDLNESPQQRSKTVQWALTGQHHLHSFCNLRVKIKKRQYTEIYEKIINNGCLLSVSIMTVQ